MVPLGSAKAPGLPNPPGPVFVSLEEGTNDLDVARTPLIRDLDSFYGYLKELGTEEHPYKTVVIDTLDALEVLIHRKVAEAREVESYADIGYGKGPIYSADEWVKLLSWLDALSSKGMNIILLCHSTIRKYTPPNGESFDRFRPKLEEQSIDRIVGWASEWFYADFIVKTKEKKDGFGKRNLAVSRGERTMYCESLGVRTAKNRCNMPEQVAFTWADYAQYLTTPEGETK